MQGKFKIGDSVYVKNISKRVEFVIGQKRKNIHQIEIDGVKEDVISYCYGEKDSCGLYTETTLGRVR